MNKIDAIHARFSGHATNRSLRGDLRLLLIGLLALVVWDALALDLPLTRLFGDAQGFSWREHWLTATVLHDGVRSATWIFVAVLLAGIWVPLPVMRALTQRERLWLIGTTLLCITLTQLLKRSSLTSCPWSLAEFGGDVKHHVSHWLFGQRDGGSGGCFPSGHSSTAFSFLAGWFALRQRAPDAARVWLIVTVAAGLILGWSQLVRGAHYASHSLWAAWICWAMTLISFHLLQRWRLTNQDGLAAIA